MTARIEKLTKAIECDEGAVVLCTKLTHQDSEFNTRILILRRIGKLHRKADSVDAH